MIVQRSGRRYERDMGEGFDRFNGVRHGDVRLGAQASSGRKPTRPKYDSQYKSAIDEARGRRAIRLSAL
jgi:hypothetical protein